MLVNIIQIGGSILLGIAISKIFFSTRFENAQEYFDMCYEHMRNGNKAKDGRCNSMISEVTSIYAEDVPCVSCPYCKYE